MSRAKERKWNAKEENKNKNKKENRRKKERRKKKEDDKTQNRKFNFLRFFLERKNFQIFKLYKTF